MAYNLSSPSGIIESCDLSGLADWLERELAQVESLPMRTVLREVGENLDQFVRWPAEALLLWQSCDRTIPEGKRHRYHSYPPEIKSLAKEKDIVLDGRPNGPAIAAYRIAGGQRPTRFGSSNAWSVHHLYSGSSHT